jgi:TolB-like protein/cytochrome c-type biogenesis protein CcmH/NrfG
MASRDRAPEAMASMGSAHVPSPEQVGAELDRLLASPEFQSNQRLAAFLSHVIRKALAERSDEIKEATIGIEVFGRQPGYDTRSDAIVRTEARRLREKLAQYYGAAGRHATVRIEIPKGSYVPQFHAEAPASTPEPATTARPHRVWRTVAIASFIILVILGLAARFGFRADPVRQRVQTIAILPFTNAEPGGRYQYLSEGLKDDLERDFARVKQLRIHTDPPAEWLVPRNAIDYRALNRRLLVDVVLDGQLSSTDGKAEIRVSLIRASDASILWAERFESGRSAMTTGAVEAQIEEAVTKTLGVAFPRIARSENPQAHDLFLEGRNLWATRKEKEGQESIALFERALKLDPAYALAYMGIADAYGLMTLHGEVDPATGIRKAKQAALKALELDPTLAEAHSALGLVDFVSWDWKGAEQEYQRAIELNPSYDRPYVRLGALRFYAGDFRNAEQLIIQAESLSPYSLSLPIIRSQLYYYAHRYDDSVKLVREVQKVDARNTSAMAMLACDFWQQRKSREALDTLRKLKELEPGFQLELMPCMAAIGGAGAKAGEENAYVQAVAATATHDRERVLAALEKALADRTPDLPEARFEPDFDFVRADKRFEAVIAKELAGGDDPTREGANRPKTF